MSVSVAPREFAAFGQPSAAQTLPTPALRLAASFIIAFGILAAAANAAPAPEAFRQTLKTNFDRGLELLAQNELSPALPENAFKILQPELAAAAAGWLSRAKLGLPLDEPIRAARRYVRMDAAAVQAAFRRWIRPEDFVQVSQGHSPR